MRIAFICGSLEPGIDGVGDYTRRLAVHLTKAGYEVLAIAYNDRHIDAVRSEKQIADGVEVNALRFPADEMKNERASILKRELESFDPAWLSLQYVPYSYHKRGIAFGLPGELKKVIVNAKVHIMYHELWQGESNESNLKDKILGYFQKRVSLGLISRLRPACVTTTNEYYKRCFEKAGKTLVKIPVFSNMPVGNVDSKKVSAHLPANVSANRNSYIIGSFFGGFHLHSAIVDQLTMLREKVKLDMNKELLVTHIGRSSGIEEVFEDIQGKTGIEMCVLGEWPEHDVADHLTQADLGLSNYPKILAEKSGSIAALLNNGCPVLILRRGFEEDGRSVSEIEELKNIKDIEKFIHQDKDFSNLYGIQNTVDRYKQIFEVN